MRLSQTQEHTQFWGNLLSHQVKRHKSEKETRYGAVQVS